MTLPSSLRPRSGTMLSLGNRFRRELPTVMLLAVFALAPLALEPYLLSGLTRILIYGLAACAVAFLIHHGGMISFGHAGFFGLGGYTVLVADVFGWTDALVIWPAAILVAGLAGFVIGSMSLKTRGVAFIMITLGFAQMVFFIVSSVQAVGASDGLSIAGRNHIAGLPLSDTVTFHFVVLGIFILVLLLFNRVSGSPYGLALRGIGQNERRLVALGFNTNGLQLSAFTLSAAVTGLAGALAANFYLFVSPAFLGWLLSGELLVMAALGGLGALAGGLFGALLIVGVESVLAEYTTYWRIVLGPLVILAVLFFRSGLEPSLKQLTGGRNG